MDSSGGAVFVSRALSKILQLSSKKHVALRDACNAALATFESPKSASGPPKDEFSAEKYFLPFRLACETKNTKLMETALDCIQKMIQYGHLSTPGKTDRKFIDSVVETVCGCFDHPDDTVQLQILKALLQAVTSTTFELHEQSLLQTVRTCYNIYLVSKNPVNQTTARATLTQMLNVIFFRMEQAGMPSISRNGSADSVLLKVPSFQETLSPELLVRSILTEIVDKVLHEEDMPKVILPGAAETDGGAVKLGNCIVCGKPATFSCEQTQQPMCSMACKAKNLESLSKNTGKPSSGKAQDNSDEFGAAEPAGAGFGNVFQKDAYLLFRALCKLSMKPLPEGNVPDSVPLRSKLLSLELLQSVLENSVQVNNSVFRNNERFIQAIKQYLCVSLLKNCVYAIPSVFQLCLNLFQILTAHFKDHLKTEVGVFFTNIFLKILESANMAIHQKQMVLNVLYKLCQDPQTIVDLFLNYDCDLEALDIFERMVNDLSKITQTTLSITLDKESNTQELALKSSALHSLTIILKSMVEWSNRPSEPEELSHSESVDSGLGADENGQKGLIKSGSFSGVRRAEDLFAKQKNHKLELEQAVIKFNLYPKKGIKLLIDTQKLDGSPESIAKFFRTTEGLDKTKIGEYLGEGDQFNIHVLYAFVDSMDFKTYGFDDAIRLFLSGFRLPGEAQKIDRMMEKFAERYCKDNPGVFASADTAYVLAYSVIMLNTDAHNPQVRKKMTVEEFIKNNRGINDSADLPREFLEELYNRIQTNEIKMRDEDSPSDPNGLSSPLTKKKTALFHDEVRHMVVRSQNLMKKKSRSKAVFYKATNVQHVLPMFRAAWCPMLAAFSVVLEESDDPAIIAMCLEGFRHAIRIAGFFYMDTERDAFVSSLAKFTYLQSRAVMQPKNIEAIKTLIAIAHTDGNYLLSSWGLVLQSISQLERLQLIGLGAGAGATFSSPGMDDNSSRLGSGSDRGGGGMHSHKVSNVDHLNSQNILEEIDVQSIDRIFTNSANLSSDAIVEFVKALCAVSREEISNVASARVFSLQKIVEIAYFNMGRIRLVWSKIWSHLGDFFISAGCHPNMSIAMYAIDSLRQLSMKFLEKDELSNYQFQKEFLKPFEFIMQNSSSVEIRELVIRCLSQMIQARVSNVRSGWKSMFAVFSAGAADTNDTIVALAFDTTEKIVKENFQTVLDTFVDCVNCLISFGGNKLSTSISMKAIDHVRYCAAKLADGAVCDLQSSTDGPIQFTDDKVHIKLWFPIFTGLSRLINDSRSPVRARALEVLFGTVRTHGSMFHQQLWELIFRGVLIPIFDDVRHTTKAVKEDNEWLKTTCFAALQSLTELFSVFFDTLEFLLNEILDLLKSCITQESEGLARIGVTCLSQLVTSTGDRFSDCTWTTVCTAIQQLFDATAPRQLFTIVPVVHADDPSHQLNDGPSDDPHNINHHSSRSLVGISPRIEPTTPSSNPLSPPPDITHPSSNAGDSRNPSRRGSMKHDADMGLDDSRHDAHAQQAPTAGEGLSNVDFKDIRCKCIVQLLLIQAVGDLVGKHYLSLSVSHLTVLLDALESSYEFARSFNNNIDLRISLWRAGFMNQVPNLLKQEGNGTSTCLRILFRMYGEKDPNLQDRRTVAEPRLIEVCHDVVSNYVSKSNDHSLVAEQQRELVALTSIVTLVLRGFYHLEPDQFEKHMGYFYDLFSALIMSDSLEIRQLLKDLFITKVATLLRTNS
mmetsp:Transcript_25861/g.43279  ORF Transcript_25861/g.43279 Transcript_25861/m.43279 type:complete len:1714 (+) Transcript_25861:76-5217(+)